MFPGLRSMSMLYASRAHEKRNLEVSGIVFYPTTEKLRQSAVVCSCFFFLEPCSSHIESIAFSSHPCYTHSTEIPRRSMAQRTTKNQKGRKESPNVPDKGRAATSRSRTTERKRNKRVSLLVITFINIDIIFLDLDGFLLFSV
jgi:hypothetical protein